MRRGIPGMDYDSAETIELSSKARICLAPSEDVVEFDTFLDEPNHDDPEFCYRCGEALSKILPDEFQWYGLYCPFPDEKPVIERLAELRRNYRKCNGNLVFEIQNLAQDVMEFSSHNLLYFDVCLFLVASRKKIQDLECPPKFHFWNIKWNWFSGSRAYDFCAMISNDHPGCSGFSPFAIPREKIVNEFRNSFSSF